MTGALTALLVAASKSKSSGSSATFLVFLVLIAVVGYFLLIRPQKQKQRRQREQQSSVAVGDEVVTVGGIVGKVVAVDADRVTIVSGADTVGFPAVGSEPTRLVLVKNAIGRKLDPAASPDDDDAADHETDPVTNGAGDFADHGVATDAEGDGRTGAPLPGAESEGAGS